MKVTLIIHITRSSTSCVCVCVCLTYRVTSSNCLLSNKQPRDSSSSVTGHEEEEDPHIGPARPTNMTDHQTGRQLTFCWCSAALISWIITIINTVFIWSHWSSVLTAVSINCQWNMLLINVLQRNYRRCFHQSVSVLMMKIILIILIIQQLAQAYWSKFLWSEAQFCNSLTNKYQNETPLKQSCGPAQLWLQARLLLVKR